MNINCINSAGIPLVWNDVIPLVWKANAPQRRVKLHAVGGDGERGHAGLQRGSLGGRAADHRSKRYGLTRRGHCCSRLIRTHSRTCWKADAMHNKN